MMPANHFIAKGNTIISTEQEAKKHAAERLVDSQAVKESEL